MMMRTISRSCFSAVARPKPGSLLYQFVPVCPILLLKGQRRGESRAAASVQEKEPGHGGDRAQSQASVERRGAPLDAKSIAAPCYDMLSESKNRVTVVT
jgi:hypothetical protein